MTGLILLTYGQIGDELLNAATHILNQPVEKVKVIHVYDKPDTADKLPADLQQAIEQLETSGQCLILSWLICMVAPISMSPGNLLNLQKLHC